MAIYKRAPILIREGEPNINPWGMKFQLMFMMNTDSDKFHTRDDLEARGFALEGNHFVRGGERYLPLYEAKMFDTYNHRFAEVVISKTATIRKGQPRYFTQLELSDPRRLPLPRYWVVDSEVMRQVNSYYLAYRRVTSPTNMTSFQPVILPQSGAGDSAFIIHCESNRHAMLLGNLAVFPFDYVVRQKVGGVNLNFYLVEQLPVIPPHTYTPALLDFISPRVLELTYTAWDLQPFARDLGYDGAPFAWDEERRFLMRCELDALYFHLYGIGRADVDYIMETFPIVKRKDVAAHGEYRSKRVILELYDCMADLPTMLVPAPKPEHGEIEAPDLSQWASPLDPPPAKVSVHATRSARGA